MLTVQVALSKNAIEKFGGSYMFNAGDQRVVEFPMPDEVIRLVQEEGYTVLGIRVKEGYLSNYGNQLS